MIITDNDLFLEAEAYYVDIHFYKMKSEQKKGKRVAEAKGTPSVPKCPLAKFTKPVTKKSNIFHAQAIWNVSTKKSFEDNPLSN